jgi:hypothetical protein
VPKQAREHHARRERNAEGGERMLANLFRRSVAEASRTFDEAFSGIGEFITKVGAVAAQLFAEPAELAACVGGGLVCGVAEFLGAVSDVLFDGCHDVILE